MILALINKDKKKRFLFCKYELYRINYKSLIHDLSIPIIIRWNISMKLSKLPRNSSKIRIRNRCVITGRGSSVYRYFKISRIQLRELASSGMLPGLRKSSW